jgi:peroxiredoxin
MACSRYSAFVLCFLLLSGARVLADERVAELDKLIAGFHTASESFFEERQENENPSPAERIKTYEAYPLWSYLPKVLAVAESKPDDEAALKACQWIIENCGRCGNRDLPIYEAEKRAWQIVEKHHADDEQIALLCLRAAQYDSPAREAFLRNMASRGDLPGDAEAYALLALAEYMGDRYELGLSGSSAYWNEPKDDLQKHLRERIAPEWMVYASNVNAEAARAESIELFRHVLDQYADTPFTLTAPGFRDLKTIGDKARKTLHALEHLYVGAPAPDFDARDLDGNPLRLADHRGKVVLLSFWFTGCGPCIGMIPKEQELVEKYRDQPFALIGVCRDSDAAMGQKTVAEHGMTWPSIHDGQPGWVTNTYNVLGWPSFYLIDADGKIAAKNASWDELEKEIDELVAQAAKLKDAQSAQ